MLTRMTEQGWDVVLDVFQAARSRRGDKGRNDRHFLEALHYFTVHNITWRALPAEFGNWNSIWKRFWRLSRTGVCEAFSRCSTALWCGRTSRLQVPKGAGRPRAGRSRGGFSTKIHLKTDFEGLPLDFHLTGGRSATAVNSKPCSTSAPT
jgi:transposase